MNRATLIGRVGNEPDVRSMQTGNKVVSFSLATSESWKDKNTGERKEKTEWHKIVVFNEGTVKVVEQYVKKGSKILIEGQIETRKWTDQSGVEKYTTEIVLRPFAGKLILLDGKEKAEQVSDNSAVDDFSDCPF